MAALNYADAVYLGQSRPLKLGAVVVVLSLALDPFSQQLVQLSERRRFIEGSDGFEARNWQAESYSRGQLIKTSHQMLEKRDFMDTMNASVDIHMEAAIVNGMTLPTWRVTQLQDVQCPSESCKWPKFDTLGVCHRCTDVTSKLRKEKGFAPVVRAMGFDFGHGGLPEGRSEFESTALVLPNGQFLAAPDGCTTSSLFSLDNSLGHQDCKYSNGGTIDLQYRLRMTSFGTGNPNKTNTMQDIDTLIWSTSVIHPDVEKPGEEWPGSVHAMECALYYCVKTVDVSVHRNNLTEKAVEATDARLHPDSWLPKNENENEENEPDLEEYGPLEFNYLSAVIRRDPLVLHFPGNSSKPKYEIYDQAVSSISSHFQQLFKDDFCDSKLVRDAITAVLGEDAVGFNGYLEGNANTPPNVGNLWYFPHPGLQEAGVREQKDPQTAFASIATSMTNAMRKSDDYNQQDGYSRGLLSETRTYYEVIWGWIVLHGVILVGAVVTWGVTFAKSIEAGTEVVPAWKSSALPVISETSSARLTLRGAKTMKEMERRAKDGSMVITLEVEGIPLTRENGGNVRGQTPA